MSYHLIKTVYLILDDADRRFFKQFGLSIVQYYSLHWLRNDGEMNLSQLSGRLLCDPGHVTRTVETLVRGGLVSRQRAGKDRRVVRVSLTPNGRDLYQTVSRKYKKIIQERMSALSDAEQAVLTELLARLEKGLTQSL